MTADLDQYYQRERQKLLADIGGCIRYGSFHLHSGEESEWLCDLLPLRHMFSMYRYLLKPKHQTVGIELGGYLLSGLENGIIRKDGTYYESASRNPPHVVSVMDDVVTTEASLNLAQRVLQTYGIVVAEYLCILDRRKPEIQTLNVRSLVSPTDLSV